MTKLGLWSRWHCFDNNGIKYIQKFGVDEIPKQKENCSPWARGTGPHTPEALNNIRQSIRRACLGVPKSLEQRRKMSEAKKGVPKSEQHRKNMSAAHRRRREKLERENNAGRTEIKFEVSK